LLDLSSTLRTQALTPGPYAFAASNYLGVSMRKRERMGTAEVPGGKGRMELFRQGEEWSIWVEGDPLMTSTKSGSEVALAELGCQALRGRPDGCVLVGGLGMGFTLAAALRVCGPQAQVLVAELVPEVVAWNREHLGPFAGNPLADPRSSVAVEDVAQAIRRMPNTFDAILLDVDNGPSAMTQDANVRLYQPQGLAEIRKALVPGGTVAFWSAYADPAFTRRLERQGFSVREQAVGAHKGRGSRHVIWLGTKQGA
jgi:spermidine synthase